MARKSKAKKMSKQDQEMELLLSEQTDPVSGNTAPLGAKPEEVRDDVEINVSPNEFVINAATVRYFGEDFFRELQETAAEGWERIKEGEESPFRDDELEVMEEGEPKEGYAEGGPVPKPVGGGYGGYGGRGATFSGFESKTFVNTETGQEMIIFFFMGRPMSRIPAGFVEKGTLPAEAAEQATAQATDSGDDRGLPGDVDPTWRNKPVNDWSMSDFETYRSDMGKKETPGEMSLIEKGIVGFVGSVIGGPAGAIGLQELAKRSIKKQAEAVATQANSIISAGLNPDTGEKLTAADLDILNRARIEADFVAFEQSQPGIIQNVLGIEAEPGMNVGVPIYEQEGYFNQAVGDVSITESQDSGIYTDPFSGKQITIGAGPDSGKTTSEGYSVPTAREMQGYAGAVTYVDVDPNLEVKGLMAPVLPTGTQDTSTTPTEPKKTTAEEVKAAEDASSAATDAWVAATNAARNVSTDDPAAWNAAMQAQAQASREATAAAKAATAARNNDDDPSNDSPSNDCVIATHGVSTGGFSRLDKAKAELWCERTYHGKWYGEAFRRGYRHAGRKAIERGEAEKHYQEFKDFVSYGRGLKTDLKSRLNYYKRTVQFFVTGMFVKD